jgi:hypothetical protein
MATMVERGPVAVVIATGSGALLPEVPGLREPRGTSLQAASEFPPSHQG